MEKHGRLPAEYNRHATGSPFTNLSQPAGWRGGNGNPPEAELDLRDWAYILWRRKWLIFLVTVLGTALSVVIARRQPPVYETRALVWIEESKGGPGIIDVGANFSNSGWMDLLSSYAVLDAVVHKLKLYLSLDREGTRPLFNDFELTTPAPRTGKYRLAVRLDNTWALYTDDRGEPLQTGAMGDTIGGDLGFRWVPPLDDLRPGREIVFSISNPRDVADRMRKKQLQVDMDRGGNFIRINHTHQDPDLAARVLNAILDEYVELATELKRERLTQLSSTLEEQLGVASDRLRRAERELEDFRVNTIILPDDRRDPVVLPPRANEPTAVVGAGDPVFDRYFALNVEQETIAKQREDLAAVLNTLEETGDLDAMRLELVPAARQSTALMAALDELGRKELEHRTLLYRYTPEYAEVRKLADEIATLEEQTIPTLVRQVMDRLREQERELGAEVQVQTAELRAIPPRAIEESRLRRELALAEQLYNTLQVRYKEVQVAEAATQPNVRALDRASPPTYPLTNIAPRIIFLGFVISLGLSIGAVIVHERFVNRRLQRPEQVVSDLGLPILGVVPNLRALESRAGSSVDSSHVQSVVESFRALRTQLTHGLGIEFPAVIAITSPAMGEGKSLVTSNLALAFAEPDRPTLLIDGDVRRGSLHRVFEAERAPGLCDYLRGDANTALVVRETSSPGLFFTPRGRFSEEMPELLDGEGLPTLLNDMKQHFRIILIDTPPLSAGVDAVLIGAQADAVMAVLRSGRTDLDLARAKLSSYAQMLGVPMLGAILNDVEMEGPYRYYTYSYEVYPHEA